MNKACYSFQTHLGGKSPEPEGPVVLAVGLHVAEIEAQTLRDVQHITEIQTYGVEKHRGHANLIQGPHVLAATGVVGLPPAELHTKLASTGRQLNRYNPGVDQKMIKLMFLMQIQTVQIEESRACRRLPHTQAEGTWARGSLGRRSVATASR